VAGGPQNGAGCFWGAAGRPLKDRRDVNFLTRPFSRAASHGAGPAPRACPALKTNKQKTVDLSFHLLLFLLWGAAASQTPRLILGGSPTPPAGGEQNNTKHIFVDGETLAAKIILGCFTVFPVAGPGVLGRFLAGFGRKVDANGPKSDPKLPRPETRAVWGHRGPEI